ncbi:MAG: hypothetical protein Q4E49_04155 [Bacteroidales bacterium]|nr:hypothetical protein [Bacteroidales bacterium]
MAVILLIFATKFSEGLENVIICCMGGFSLFFLVKAMKDNKNKSLHTLVGIIGLVITFCLIAWTEYNTSVRTDWKYKEIDKEYNIKHAADSIQHIKDSIQNYKDSMAMVAESERLYALEGDSIFGDFRFGMSEKQCEAIRTKIQKETNGSISIADYDFKIDYCRFHHNKLYFIRLKSANTWVRYYFYEDNEYDDSEGLGTGDDIVDKIKNRLSKKYGKPNNCGDWHFTYKDINVRSGSSEEIREGLLRTEYWAVFITIYNPQMADESEKEEKEEYLKQQNEQKAAEEELKRKKESFTSGL